MVASRQTDNGLENGANNVAMARFESHRWRHSIFGLRKVLQRFKPRQDHLGPDTNIHNDQHVYNPSQPVQPLDTIAQGSHEEVPVAAPDNEVAICRPSVRRIASAQLLPPETGQGESNCSTHRQPSRVPSSLFSTKGTKDGLSENETTATTPLPPTDHPVPSQRSIQRPTGSELIEELSSKDDDYIRGGYLITGKSQKEWARFKLDTGAAVNVLRRGIFEGLDCSLLPCGEEVLVPLQTGSEITRSIQPIGIVRDIDWHFAKGTKTYTSDFYVVDTDQYDAIIGRQTINECRFFVPSEDIPKVIERSLT
ncbi:hypothetical protein BBP40_001200 [Aspergillus hancockii]|nr:hypothetical protein BBP40_001200 [Aspergillus hancockii]